MSGRFDRRWLAQREPVDHRSRPAMAVTLLGRAWRERGWRRVVDLGSGTGSNVRYLSPRLPEPQQWTLVDRDRALLDAAVAPKTAGAPTRVACDLAHQLSDRIEAARADLVTASALLDLVSDEWLAQLVDACRRAARGAYVALSYDGSIQWHVGSADPRPADDPDDGAIRRAVNAHQRRDKGFGPALGPMAGLKAETAFRAAGYRVWLFQSRWRLGPAEAALARRLVDGWEQAVLELEPPAVDRVDEPRVRAWAGRRRDTVAQDDFGLTVGHLDLLALPGPQ